MTFNLNFYIILNAKNLIIFLFLNFLNTEQKYVMENILKNNTRYRDVLLKNTKPLIKFGSRSIQNHTRSCGSCKKNKLLKQ